MQEYQPNSHVQSSDYPEQTSTPAATVRVNYLVLSILFLLVAGIAGTTGYYFGNKTNSSTTSEVNIKTETTSTQIIPTASPTASPIESTEPTTKNWGPESLWYKDEGKSLSYLKKHLTFSLPTGWTTIECGNSLNLNPSSMNQSCATEPNAFSINISADSPYIYQIADNNSDSVISEQKQLTIDGKKAVQYKETVTEGQGQGEYLKTVIFVSDAEYIYITLNDLTQKSEFDTFISSIKTN